MTPLAVIVLTYASAPDSPRRGYAIETVKALAKNLCYSGPIVIHIADDGSYPGHAASLENFASDSAKRNPQARFPSSSNAERKGYGASYNMATQRLHDDYGLFLVVEDDWRLTRELNLDPLAAALAAGTAVECIRLGYIGWTQELRGLIIKQGEMSFLGFAPDSPEPHVWAGHPRLETRAFQRRVGPWTEGLDPGSTEFEVAQRPEARVGVAWPLDLNIRASQHHDSLFTHIGAVQARTDQ